MLCKVCFSISRSLSDLSTKSNFEHSFPFEKGGLRGILHIQAGVLSIKSPSPLYKRGRITKVRQAPRLLRGY